MNSERVPDPNTPDAAGGPVPDRDRIATDRDRIATDRDERAESHDDAAEDRDRNADARDDRAEARERDMHRPDRGAIADRKAALRDREGSGGDRTQSADDRSASASDRDLSAEERALLSTDQLTHTYRRDVGETELIREIVRAQRMEQPYVVAFVDVDHLKERNDALGHPAGDDLLATVADALRAETRPYDLLIRYGGDEFVCGLPDVTPTQISERFARMNADLVTSHQASVSFGLAEMRTDETAEDLIARADAALYAERQRRRDTRT